MGVQGDLVGALGRGGCRADPDDDRPGAPPDEQEGPLRAVLRAGRELRQRHRREEDHRHGPPGVLGHDLLPGRMLA